MFPSCRAIGRCGFINFLKNSLFRDYFRLRLLEVDPELVENTAIAANTAERDAAIGTSGAGAAGMAPNNDGAVVEVIRLASVVNPDDVPAGVRSVVTLSVTTSPSWAPVDVTEIVNGSVPEVWAVIVPCPRYVCPW